MHLPRLALAALSVFSLASTAVTAATTGSAESAHGQVPFLSPEQLAQAQGQAEKHAYQDADEAEEAAPSDPSAVSRRAVHKVRPPNLDE